MKAALLHRFNEPLLVANVAVEEPKAGEVLVKLAASGICGSDLHAWKGSSNITKNMPMILGHEGAGVVEQVGEGVSDLKRGDHVVISMSGPCGHCEFCGSGQLEYCDGPERGNIWGEMVDGTTRFAREGAKVYPMIGVGSLGEYAVVRRAMLVKIDQDLPLSTLCIVPCGVTTGLGSVFNVACVTPGSSVLVVGCGGVGVNVIQGARIAGAANIIAADTNPAKFDLASDLGATHCIEVGEDAEEFEAKVRSIAPKGVNFAFDVVGSAAIIRQLVGLTAPGGTTCVIGVVPWAEDVGAPAGLFLVGQRRLIGVGGGGNRPVRDIGRIVALYRQGKLQLDRLIGKTFDLDEVNDAFVTASVGDFTKVTVKLDPRLT